MLLLTARLQLRLKAPSDLKWRFAFIVFPKVAVLLFMVRLLLRLRLLKDENCSAVRGCIIPPWQLRRSSLLLDTSLLRAADDSPHPTSLVLRVKSRCWFLGPHASLLLYETNDIPISEIISSLKSFSVSLCWVVRTIWNKCKQMWVGGWMVGCVGAASAQVYCWCKRIACACI